MAMGNEYCIVNPAKLIQLRCIYSILRLTDRTATNKLNDKLGVCIEKKQQQKQTDPL